MPTFRVRTSSVKGCLPSRNAAFLPLSHLLPPSLPIPFLRLFSFSSFLSSCRKYWSRRFLFSTIPCLKINTQWSTVPLGVSQTFTFDSGVDPGCNCKEKKPRLQLGRICKRQKPRLQFRNLRVADISEAVRQYADALMFSGESAVGPYGQKALSFLDTTSRIMELWSREEKRQDILPQHNLGSSLSDQIAEQICSCAARIANNLGLDAIFVYTRLGQMASLISRNNPNPPIFAFTSDSSRRMALNLQWGSPFLVTF